MKPAAFYQNNFYPGKMVHAVYLGNKDGSYSIEVMTVTRAGYVVSNSMTILEYIAKIANGLPELYKARKAHAQAIKDAAKCAEWQEGRVAS